jgi:hypothetical protein
MGDFEDTIFPNDVMESPRSMFYPQDNFARGF